MLKHTHSYITATVQYDESDEKKKRLVNLW